MIESINASSDETFDLETQMRECAPALPAALRNRTLEACKLRALAQQRRQARLHWMMTGAFAGIIAFQSLTLCAVDAQNTQLITRNAPSPAPLFASISVSQINGLWHRRSRELAQLMEPSRIG